MKGSLCVDMAIVLKGNGQKFVCTPDDKVYYLKHFVKWYMKYFIYWNADVKTSKQLWAQSMQLCIEAWKIQELNGIWTRDLAIPVRRCNQGPSDPSTTTSTSTSFSMCTRCACLIAWGCHVNSFCRQNLVAVLTPTTRFSTNLVPRLRVLYRCKDELKG